MAQDKPTIYDIAKKLSVTPSTVSRALNDHSRISTKTKKAVKRVAQELNYQHNAIASALRLGKTKIIGVMVPTIDVYFFSSVIKGIEEIASEAGYSVMITQSNDLEKNEISCINAMLRAQVDGILASVARESKSYDHYKRITDIGIPLVLFDRDAAIVNSSAVVADDYLGAYKATEHLIQMECKRIAHFGSKQHLNTYKLRMKGYKEALLDNGFEVDRDLIYISNVYLEDGRKGMKHLLQLTQPPDAIFSASDYAALGAMQVLKSRGISIPDEIALVGFADEPVASYIQPQLTSVNMKTKEMGQFAARKFLDQVKQGADQFISTKSILSPELMIRTSSLKC